MQIPSTTMQIEIQVHAEKPGELRSYIERRLSVALDRFMDRLGTVEVRISDVNGPQGRVDKSCEIRVQLSRSGVLLIQEARDANVYASIDSAVERISRSFSRHLERNTLKPRNLITAA
jgi:ribosomal subunit interface protein